MVANTCIFSKSAIKGNREILVPFYFYHFGVPLKSEIGNTTQYLGIHAIPTLHTVKDITFFTPDNKLQRSWL